MKRSDYNRIRELANSLGGVGARMTFEGDFGEKPLCLIGIAYAAGVIPPLEEIEDYRPGDNKRINSPGNRLLREAPKYLDWRGWGYFDEKINKLQDVLNVGRHARVPFDQLWPTLGITIEDD